MPKAKKAHSTDGRVAAIARELWALIQADLSIGFSVQKCAETDNRREQRERFDRMEFLASAIAYGQARSPADALAQIVVASYSLGKIEDGLAADPQTLDEGDGSPEFLAQIALQMEVDAEKDRDEAQASIRAMHRCLYSIRKFLEKEHGLRGADFAAEYYMPAYQNPFACVQAALNAEAEML